MTPVHRDPHSGVLLVSSHAHVSQALDDAETFSSRTGAAPGDAGSDPQLAELQKQTIPFVDALLTTDPPEHERLRGFASEAFAPRRVNAHVAALPKLCHALVDDFVARGHCELRSEYAAPLPLAVIAGQLGVPRAELPLLRRWTDGFAAQQAGLAAGEDPLEAIRRILEFQHYFAVRIDEARRTPRGDLLSDFVRVHEGRRALDLAETLSIIRQLLVSGVDTTASAITEGVRCWTDDAELLAQLRGDPSLLPIFVEEVLRLASPTESVWRRAARDCELGGVLIPAGSRVRLQIGAANRDAHKFAEPDRIDLHRANAADHLAFGRGIHACLGAALARPVITAAFRVLIERLDDLRLAPGPGLTIAFRPAD
jgi:cytochrome P450